MYLGKKLGIAPEEMMVFGDSGNDLDMIKMAGIGAVYYTHLYHGVHGRKKLDEIVETSLRKAALWDEVKDRLKKSALGLSGGQQQRLCIARAIALEPEIILMDEATSALDPISTQKTEELMVELQKNYTVIIVTHNMQQAARVADKTALFFKGDLIE